MNGDHDPDGGPELGDGPAPDAFDAIVAGWQREGWAPRWPDEPTVTRALPAVPPPVPDPARVDPVPLDPLPLDAAPPDAVPASFDEEHFVPPEPPPLPRIGPPALVGLVLIGLGLVLVAWPGQVGVPEPYGLPLGLVTIAAGLGWLVLRLWPDAEGSTDDEDDGAVL